MSSPTTTSFAHRQNSALIVLNFASRPESTVRNEASSNNPAPLFGPEHSAEPHDTRDVQTVGAFSSSSPGRQALILRLCEEGVMISNCAAAGLLAAPIIGGSAPSVLIREAALCLLIGSALALIYRGTRGAVRNNIPPGTESQSRQVIRAEMMVSQSRMVKIACNFVTVMALLTDLNDFLNGHSPRMPKLTAIFLTYGSAAVEGIALRARHRSFFENGEQLRSWLVLSTEFLLGLFAAQHISYVCNPQNNLGDREDFSGLSGSAFFLVVFASLAMILRCTGIFFSARNS